MFTYVTLWRACQSRQIKCDRDITSTLFDLALSFLQSAIYLLLFDAFIDLGCGLLVGPKKTDDVSSLRVQDVPVIISNNLVQFEDPGVGSNRGKIDAKGNGDEGRATGEHRKGCGAECKGEDRNSS